jgi:hypothetical protein
MPTDLLEHAGRSGTASRILPSLSIKSLYRLALAEGEGIGTAYEYFAKRLVLRRWLAECPPAPRVLIAGLPEKYGSSLDFLLIAQELGAVEIMVIDERAEALERNRKSLAAAQASGDLVAVEPQFLNLSDLGDLDGLRGSFDVCVSSEVLQRLDPTMRERYLTHLEKSSKALALFAPNGDNPAHTNISGLKGLRLSELQGLLQNSGPAATLGYIDMPPFPPGMTRSAEQRQQASSGNLEGLAMRGLTYYARLENAFPRFWRQDHSHIVYALYPPSPFLNSRNNQLV